MVAYSFRPQFETPIKSGLKRGTIRAEGRRRHARPGERVQLYTGMRTKHCRLLGSVVCSANDGIQLDFLERSIVVMYGDGKWRLINQKRDLNDFALGDGFANFEEMAAFWRGPHIFRFFWGRWIQWGPESLLVAA